ncbi:hypothetical protein Tco_0003306 [Tanacetum coccineum]
MSQSCMMKLTSSHMSQWDDNEKDSSQYEVYESSLARVESHNEHDAKEVREMRQRYPDQLALLANQYNPPPSYNSSRSITAMNSKFSPTNNQLRTLSNLRTQATIQDGQVTIQNIQGKQSQGYGVNLGKSLAIGMKVTNTVSDVNANQSRVIRVKDVEWFKEKMLLAQAQEVCVILHEDQQDFLADRLEEMDDYDDLQLHTTLNSNADHVDAYDSDCDDEATACAIFMASLSPTRSINGDTAGPSYDSELLS